MKLANLTEGRDADLYHFMDPQKTLSIVETDSFGIDSSTGRSHLWRHETPELGTVRGTSLTRNKDLFHTGIRLTLDQAKLAARYKLHTLDAERSFHHSLRSHNYNSFRDRRIHSKANQYAEEFLEGPVKNLHKYIKAIKVYDFMNNRLRIDKTVELYDKLLAYAKKHSIPLEVHPRLSELIEKDRERLRRIRAGDDE